MQLLKLVQIQCVNLLAFLIKKLTQFKAFFCKNCLYKQHQCFACGELGSSDKASGAEVFSCVSATCGHFYHPHCIAKLLHRDSESNVNELQKKIAAGEPFTCPVHKCYVCNQGENKMYHGLQFAMCRCCPRSYHRKCLPGKIAFEDNEDEGIIQRAWEGLLPNRILIYCLKHTIDDELATPARNHIKFPNVAENKRKKGPELLSGGEKVIPKKKGLVAKTIVEKQTVAKPPKAVEKSSAVNKVGSSRKSQGRPSAIDSSKKQRVVHPSRKILSNSSFTKVKGSAKDEGNTSFGESLYAVKSTDSESVRTCKGETIDSLREPTLTVKPVGRETKFSLPLDDDSQRRILTLMKDAASSITLEKIIGQHKLPTTHSYLSKTFVDRAITLGKVEGSIEALRAALQKLDEGCNIEDTKAVCEPGLLNQIIKWKNKLKVYLAPFIYGMRYTSFGRHFTKMDKLKEIVDVLHWYVQDGDTIVDFCCGANDFSCLMKKKIDEMGKKCFYKNYDILQAKNDFNFEKRDWMSVCPKELPPSSQLIMGLNPPFGVNVALANKFIDKALEFKPKLLILIAPQKTKRLDKKDPPYDLIWEDDELLIGKSFNLPGSVDVNDKQMENWNVNPTPLYLWSQPDWTTRHKSIAYQHGHSSRTQEKLHLDKNNHDRHVSDFLGEDCDPKGQNSMLVDGRSVQDDGPDQSQGRQASATGIHKGFSHNNVDKEDHGKSQYNRNAETDEKKECRDE